MTTINDLIQAGYPTNVDLVVLDENTNGTVAWHVTASTANLDTVEGRGARVVALLQTNEHVELFEEPDDDPDAGADDATLAAASREHDCITAPDDEGGDLVFRGHYGAPGVGTAWGCKVCDAPWSRVGDGFYRAEEMVHELRLSDVI